MNDEPQQKAIRDIAINILEEALETDEPILSISELSLLLPICRRTFYRYGFNEDEEIQDLLRLNKCKKKAELRRNWGKFDSAPVLQIALYKLIATKEEREILNNKPTEDKKSITIKWGEK